MNVIIGICCVVFFAVVTTGVYGLQSRLERWDYQRHQND